MWSDFENYVPQKTLFQIRGKLWGKRVFLNRKILSPRFTGQTFFLYLPQQNGSAHPRLRGADSGGTPATRVSGGSSPLTRGGRRFRSFFKSPRGLIPAYAGRTRPYMRPSRYARAHPRLRGADSASFWSLSAFQGSSPLTRGGRTVTHRRVRRWGLIPAYAGRTRWSLPNQPTGGAHPRLRGADAEEA